VRPLSAILPKPYTDKKNQTKNETMITGQDIIELGFKPNKWFKEVIEYANENGLSGDSLKSYIESIRPVYIEPHSEPIHFYQNIKAENEEEADNVKMVLDTMQELMKTPTLYLTKRGLQIKIS
jgi:tRNA-splicing ligase RtcB (3'-phosphate/5'-hydroxy nucleic acid ligase)